ncbi:MAG: betaine/proline/choline family ABC transporter ATP-binding protein [Gammaproteobacteria bacterium]|nr:betaine/proline/choline family ABC transporter ATP-binding protein [Gammaproteobacteria bacterium]
MTDDAADGDAAIGCRNLWMVFGARAARRYGVHAAALAAAKDRAAALVEDGLVAAVRDVSFDVAHGELFVIMGLSGSGKSTVVRCLSRIIEPSAGEVLIGGWDILSADHKTLIEMRRHTMGMVFQHFGLFPNMTVLDNVAFPLRVRGVNPRERRERAAEVISQVGLEGKENNYPRELSGGQQQRVGIARSLAVNPRIWFLDEPFSALDPLIRRQLQDEFLHLQATLHKSIVFITHDFSEALRIADRIAIMRDGEIVQVGTPADIVLHPADDYVANFTREVPKGRLMTVGDLMSAASTPAGADAGAGPILRAGMPVEEALVRWVQGLSVQGFESLPVADGDGRIVGELTPDSLALAVGQGFSRNQNTKTT